jgi:hypothetical protein
MHVAERSFQRSSFYLFSPTNPGDEKVRSVYAATLALFFCLGMQASAEHYKDHPMSSVVNAVDAMKKQHNGLVSLGMRQKTWNLSK